MRITKSIFEAIDRMTLDNKIMEIGKQDTKLQNMLAKGTTVKSVLQYFQKQYPDVYKALQQLSITQIALTLKNELKYAPKFPEGSGKLWPLLKHMNVRQVYLDLLYDSDGFYSATAFINTNKADYNKMLLWRGNFVIRNDSTFKNYEKEYGVKIITGGDYFYKG